MWHGVIGVIGVEEEDMTLFLHNLNQLYVWAIIPRQICCTSETLQLDVGFTVYIA